MPSRANPRVLMYAPRVWGGGVESHLCELTSELLTRDVKVTLAVCSKFGWATSRRDHLLARGATFVDAGDGNKKSVRGVLGLAKRFQRLQRLGEFDAIVCHGVGMSHLAAATLKHQARLVWHDHLSGGETITDRRTFSPPGLKRYAWIFRRFLEHVDAVITGSERGRENLQNFQSIKCSVHVIPPLCTLPGPTDEFRRQRSRTITCAVFGNLSEQKGTECLVRLWTHPSLSHLRLLVFGNDPDGEYERLARILGLKNIEFRGPYRESQLAELAEEADFSIVASAIEGYPLVAIELMACGLPLVATKVGACPQFDASGKDVILVDHEPGSVWAGILRMAEQIENGAIDRRAIRNRAREIYDREQVAKKHIEVILG